MLYGTQPRAMNTVAVGCARVGESSLTSVPSESNDHETAAVLTPFHTFVVTVTCFAISRYGLPDSPLLNTRVGSTKTGTPNPPAVVVPSDIARDSCRSKA